MESEPARWLDEHCVDQDISAKGTLIIHQRFEVRGPVIAFVMEELPLWLQLQKAPTGRRRQESDLDEDLLPVKQPHQKQPEQDETDRIRQRCAIRWQPGSKSIPINPTLQ
jgi:hypothetical protein